jgi:hypothetical protein
MVRLRLTISSPCSVSLIPDLRRSIRLTWSSSLQLLDLHAERRLGHSAGFGRPAEMQRFRQRLEITQLTQGHHRDKANLCLA